MRRKKITEDGLFEMMNPIMLERIARQVEAGISTCWCDIRTRKLWVDLTPYGRGLTTSQVDAIIGWNDAPMIGPSIN